MGRDVKAGKGFFELYLKNSALFKGLDASVAKLRSTGRAIGSIGRSVGAAGAVLTAPLILSAREFAKFGDQIDKTSARTGVAASSLAELAFAAEQTGSDIGTLEKGFFGLSRSVFDLSRGSGEAVDAYAKLGLTFRDLEGLSPEQQFEKIADGINSLQDASERGAVAQKILGRSGRQLIPLFAAYRELREEAKSLGISISQDQAKSAADLTDAWNRVTRTLKASSFAVGAALAPALIKGANAAAKLFASVSGLISQNPKLVQRFAIFAGILTASGAALVTVGFGFVSLAAVIASFSTVAAAAFAVVGGLFSAVAAGIAIILSPVGLAVAAFLKFTSAWRGLAGELSDSAGSAVLGIKGVFAELVADVGASVGEIGKLLAAGEIGSAAKLLWANLNYQWRKGSVDLHAVMVELKTNTLTTFNELAFDMLDTWGNLTNDMKKLLVPLKFDLKNLVVDIDEKIFEVPAVKQALKALDTLQIKIDKKIAEGLGEKFDEQAALEDQARRFNFAPQREAIRANLAIDEERELKNLRALRKRDLDAQAAARRELNAEIREKGDASIADANKKLEEAKAELKLALAEAKKTTSFSALAASAAIEASKAVSEIKFNPEAAADGLSKARLAAGGSTFSGQFASQIFGAEKNDDSKTLKEQLREAKEQKKLMRELINKLVVAPLLYLP